MTQSNQPNNDAINKSTNAATLPWHLVILILRENSKIPLTTPREDDGNDGKGKKQTDQTNIRTNKKKKKNEKETSRKQRGNKTIRTLEDSKKTSQYHHQHHHTGTTHHLLEEGKHTEAPLRHTNVHRGQRH